MNIEGNAQKQYNNMSDENIIEEIKLGDKNALNFLMEKYEDLVKMKSSKFFSYGSEKNDILQEGRIGLYNASRNYNPNKYNSFRTFANLCIERQLITAIKKSNRQKHKALNFAISINETIFDKDNNEIELVDFLNNNSEDDPLDKIANQEYYNFINSQIINNLSKHEQEVLNCYKDGKSYEEIAEMLKCKTKSVDTALTRIRRKAKKIKTELQ